MKKDKVYLVVMHKWSGDNKYHWGVYTTKTKAHAAGIEEKKARGGNKYFYEIIEFKLDNLPGITVFRLQQNDEWGWWEK